jgi:hypothetical protein
MKKFAREAFTILCDDIRTEVGNKISLMGVYGKEVIVPEIPYVFTKICLLVMVKHLINELPVLEVHISRKDDPVVIMTLPPPPNQHKESDMQFGLTLSQFKISREGRVKIEIFRQGEEKPFISHQFELKKANS